MSHILTCLVCREKTDNGPSISGLLRPLCGGCDKAWWYSGERKRAADANNLTGKPSSDVTARAFTDWLTRVRAERRNVVPA